MPRMMRWALQVKATTNEEHPINNYYSFHRRSSSFWAKVFRSTGTREETREGFEQPLQGLKGLGKQFTL
jgi:hypothetical protein